MPPLQTPDPSPLAPDPARPRRRKDKVRSAWISFTGRIIAQIVGACATVWLGLHVVQHGRFQSLASASTPATTAASTSTAAAPARVHASDTVPSVAVLPLRNLSPEPNQDYLADGLTTAIITQLAAADGVHVASHTSSMAYKGQARPLPEIASELGVGLVVEGVVTRSHDHLRVTMQLVDAASDRPVWSRTFDETVDDVLSVQDRVARTAAREVSAVLTGALTRQRV
ncbi:MAG: hypothetical protein QM736_26300 [Vicinamibacterales bacterium]